MIHHTLDHCANRHSPAEHYAQCQAGARSPLSGPAILVLMRLPITQRGEAMAGVLGLVCSGGSARRGKLRVARLGALTAALDELTPVCGDATRNKLSVGYGLAAPGVIIPPRPMTDDLQKQDRRGAAGSLVSVGGTPVSLTRGSFSAPRLSNAFPPFPPPRGGRAGWYDG